MQNLRARHPDAQWVVFTAGELASSAKPTEDPSTVLRATISQFRSSWPMVRFAAIEETHLVCLTPFRNLISSSWELSQFWSKRQTCFSTVPLRCELHIPPCSWLDPGCSWPHSQDAVKTKGSIRQTAACETTASELEAILDFLLPHQTALATSARKQHFLSVWSSSAGSCLLAPCVVWLLAHWAKAANLVK